MTGIEPDTKDWTWVLEDPCPDCGYDAGSIHPVDVADRIRQDAKRWTARLAEPLVAVRPAPGVWSVLEYGCHVRDVHRVFAERIRLMLAEDDPHFPNWDQDETAVVDDYAAQNPAAVATELERTAATVADAYASVPADGWSRRGFRSNGSEFTIATIARYHLHDVVHHTWDVTKPPPA
ncbi:MAG: DinB family protein [Actinomycetota bacterium]|nr:DinB family protein [Actinomycetota bacterium]